MEEALRGVAVLKDIPRQQEKEQIQLALERSNLIAHRTNKVGKLSGGMLRRLGIAQAFLGSPNLLIMDEPTVGLDPEERIYFRKVLREYALGAGRIVLLSSHIVADIESLCDEVTILHHGQVLANGPTAKVQALAEGQVGERIVSEQKLRLLEDGHSVIQYVRVNEGIRVRYLAEDFSPSQLVSPTLEDSYTYITKKGKKQ
ncbi:MAG: ATP-binding cassette domain-containing protein [Clostridiales bacterium]|nr:ATP-binding cassette domain-containing protein [Clostridiales bacterium]